MTPQDHLDIEVRETLAKWVGGFDRSLTHMFCNSLLSAAVEILESIHGSDVALDELDRVVQRHRKQLKR